MVNSAYDFDMHQLDGFRYRCSDALRAITKASIKTARLAGRQRRDYQE